MTTRAEIFAGSPQAFRDALILPSGRGPQRFPDIVTDFQDEDFRALDPSLVALSQGKQPPTPRYWLERTKGGSKDTDCAIAILWLLCFSRRSLDMQIGAADRDQAAEIRKRCRAILKVNTWIAETVTVDNWKLKSNLNDSECEIIPADVAGSHGAIPDVLIINELSHVTKEEFALNLMDNAAKVPHGVAVIATNAGFIDTWQQRWRKTAEASARWYFSTYTRPAPWLLEAEIEEARTRNTPTRFARLWEGVWVPADAGDALDPADIDAAIVLDGPAPGLPPDERFRPDGTWYLAGLDLGLKHDHSALVVVGVEAFDEQMHVASVENWKPPYPGGSVDLERVRRGVLDAHEKYGFSILTFDPWQAARLVQELSRALPILAQERPMTPKNLDVMATQLLSVFRNRQITLYRDAGLIRDLQRMRIVERQAGYRLDPIKDEHGHGDRAMALAIAVPTALAWMPVIRQAALEDPDPEVIYV